MHSGLGEGSLVAHMLWPFWSTGRLGPPRVEEEGLWVRRVGLWEGGAEGEQGTVSAAGPESRGEPGPLRPLCRGWERDWPKGLHSKVWKAWEWVWGPQEGLQD